jgi:hypothetical protein
MAARIHRPLKVMAFNANGIWRQRYELSKQLKGLYIDVGRAIVLAVIKRLPTAVARVPAQVRSCEICGGQSGT